MIPTVDFFGTPVSRLFLGDNPVNGHSYIPEVCSGEEMMNYFTAQRVVEALFEAEKLGYTTCLPLANDFMLRVIRQYRNEGGKINWIFQPYPAIPVEVNVRMMMACNPIATYHQGTTTDGLCEAGKVDVLRDNIKKLKALGKPVGLGTHVPETILRSEDEDWGVDSTWPACHTRKRGGEPALHHRKTSNLLHGRTVQKCSASSGRSSHALPRSWPAASVLRQDRRRIPGVVGPLP